MIAVSYIKNIGICTNRGISKSSFLYLTSYISLVCSSTTLASDFDILLINALDVIAALSVINVVLDFYTNGLFGVYL